jgi:molybdopterin molybdotransferase
MRKFDLLTPAEAMVRMNAALDHAARPIPIETIAVAQAHNRVLAQAVVAPTPLPEFRRSTVDGFAVRAGDTPGLLRITGEVRMGEVAALRVAQGQAVAVPTGGHVPEDADAVLMIEDAEQVRLETEEWQVRATTQLIAGANIIEAGEDVRAGDIVVNAGTRMREQEIAGLLALGQTQIKAFRPLRVAIIPSGDELVPAASAVRPGQIRNTNGPMLAALVRRCGGVPVEFDALPDVRAAFEAAAQRALRSCDCVVFMAASSVGEKDFVPEIVNAMGSPGIVAHGIRFRPGKPTLFAVCDGKPVLGLPGNPISALVTATLFLEPTLWRLQSATAPAPNFVRATLAADVKSPKDLEHWVPVKMQHAEWRMEQGSLPIANGQLPAAIPISTKSNLIFGLVRADGLVCVPIGADKLVAGSEVWVRLFA